MSTSETNSLPSKQAPNGFGMSIKAVRTAGISISIVNYNTWARTEKCIQSLIDSVQAEDFEFEILVLDNGKEKPSERLLRMDQVRVHRNPLNIGFGRGHNFNLTRASLDFFFILNPDTSPRMSVLAEIRRKLQYDFTIVAAGPTLLLPDGSVQPSVRRLPGLRTEIGRIFSFDQKIDSRWSTLLSQDMTESYQDVGQIAGAAMMFRTDDLVALRGFDESFPMYFEDVDLCTRAQARGRITVLNNISIQHDGEGTAKAYRTRTTFWIESSRVHYYMKHERGLRLALLLCLTFVSAITHFLACTASGLLERQPERNQAFAKAAGYWSVLWYRMSGRLRSKALELLEA